MWILVSVLTGIARNYVKLPESELKKLLDLRRRLAPKQRGMTTKNRTRLRQFDDPAAVQSILHLPRRLVEEAKGRGLPDKRSAVLVEMALVIELFLMCMPRIKNVASIHLDQNLQRSRATRTGRCHLVFEPSEVKNGQHLEFDLNLLTVELLDLYLGTYRQFLAPARCRWLFGTRDGTSHVDECVLSNRMRTAILKRTGLTINPHLFRALGAKLYLDQNPGGYEVVRRMLGHTSLSTVISAYTGLESVSTARHFDQTMRKLRDSSGIGKRSRQPRCAP